MYTAVIRDISEATRFIHEGRIVAFPTGTSYGLAADVLQGNALQRLRNLKKRPEEKSFTVFMSENIWQEHLNLTNAEQEFLNGNKNRPITLLVKPNQSLKHLAQDGRHTGEPRPIGAGRIGLRVIDHPLMQKLADEANTPLTATSANIAGEKPCRDLKCILTSFPGKIDETTYDLSLAAILDDGTLPKSKPSTIIKLYKGKPNIIRPGAFK